MSLPDSIIYELSRGVARPFADWPDPSVPVFGAGVYTIWDNDGRFIYVSGRGITAETVRRNSPLGIYTPACMQLLPSRPQRRPVLCLCRGPACLADVISVQGLLLVKRS